MVLSWFFKHLQALLAHKARTVVAPSKLLKHAAVETTDLLHVDGQLIETMYTLSLTHTHTYTHTHTLARTHARTHTHTHTHRSNDATLISAAKLLRQHICAGVLHLGIKCKFVLEYQVCVYICKCFKNIYMSILYICIY